MQTPGFLEKWAIEHDFPKYRAKQIYQAVTKNLILEWDGAIELPKDLKEKLNNELPISTLKIKDVLPRRGDPLQSGGQALGRLEERAIHRIAPTDAPTVKIAFETHDNLVIESVLMRHKGNRNTVCVSTQVGCPMKCAFCATGKLGFTRNLTAEEIVDQVLEFARMSNVTRCRTPGYSPMSDIGVRVTNIVFMGMGEPFANYKNVMEAIKVLNDNQGFNLGHRHMTVSTSGIVPGILKFADEDVQVNLAISLHAPNNEIRSQIMPVNKKYSLEKLLPAVAEYMQKNNRKVFFEYILLKGINDSDEDILELIALLKKYFSDQMQLVHVNLIEFNPVGEPPRGLPKQGSHIGLPLQSPDHKTTRHIFDLLQKNKILTTVRYRFGDDIQAACGQLAGT